MILGRRLDPRDVLWLGAAPAALALGLVVATERGSILVIALFAVAGLGWLLSRQVGVVAVVLPAFLFPIGIGPVPWAALLVALAVVYWRFGGQRSPISPWGSGAVAVVGGFVVVRAYVGGYDLLDALGLPLNWTAGLIVGSCVAALPQARLALGAACVPLALLAVWEASGRANFWLPLTNFDTFTNLGSQAGAERALSSFGHPLIAGGVLAVMAALMLHHPAKWRVPVAALLAVGTVATVSRSAILGLIVATAILVLQSGRKAWQAIGGAALLLVAGWFAVASIPQLSASIEARFNDSSPQRVRDYGRSQLVEAVTDWHDHLLGGGFRETVRLMQQFGGVDQVTSFDNFYGTALWDFGWLPLLAALALSLVGYARADRGARRVAIPAVAVLAVVLFYTDGVYWPSMRVAAGLVLGIALAPALRRTADAPNESTRSRSAA